MENSHRNGMETRVMDELCSPYLKLTEKENLSSEEKYNKVLAENND